MAALSRRSCCVGQRLLKRRQILQHEMLEIDGKQICPVPMHAADNLEHDTCVCQRWRQQEAEQMQVGKRPNQSAAKTRESTRLHHPAVTIRAVQRVCLHNHSSSICGAFLDVAHAAERLLRSVQCMEDARVYAQNVTKNDGGRMCKRTGCGTLAPPMSLAARSKTLW